MFGVRVRGVGDKDKVKARRKRLFQKHNKMKQMNKNPDIRS